jgi:hypothetical protein
MLFLICNLQNAQLKEYEMANTLSTHEINDLSVQNFSPKFWNNETTNDT